MVPKACAGRGSGEPAAAAWGTRRKTRGVGLRRKHGNRRGWVSCRGGARMKDEMENGPEGGAAARSFWDGRDPLRRVRDCGSVLPAGDQKGSPSLGTRQRKEEVFGKGERVGPQAALGRRDSSDAAQRVSTNKAHPETYRTLARLRATAGRFRRACGCLHQPRFRRVKTAQWIASGR